MREYSGLAYLLKQSRQGINMELYTLTYCEAPHLTKVSDAIITRVFATVDDAYDDLFDYIKKAFTSGMLDEFSDAEPVIAEKLFFEDAFISKSKLSLNETAIVCQWYFDSLNSDDSNSNNFYKITSQPLKSVNEMELTMKDWRISESVILRDQDCQTFTGTFSANVDREAVYFSIVPEQVKGLAIEEYGLSGVIEIRNGQPALSLGLHQDDSLLHVESDGRTGLYVHSDNSTPPKQSEWFSDCHGSVFDTHYYGDKLDNWLTRARAEIADNLVASTDFNLQVEDDSGWDISDNYWRKTLFFNDPNREESTKGYFEITFYKDTTQVELVSHS